MSIVNLKANDVWNEHDIIVRTESIISSKYPKSITEIMNRKVTASILGQYTMSEQENNEILAYAKLCEYAAEAGDIARKDMQLLNKVLVYEKAKQRLSLPELLEPETILVVDQEGVETEVINPAIAIDASERQVAQSYIDSASEDVLELVRIREPEVVVEIV